MISIPRVGLFVCMTAVPLAAQLLQERSDLAVPLTAQGKAARTLRLNLRPGMTLGILVGAGFEQLSDDPEEWGQGTKGYAHRVLSAYGRRATASAISLGLSVAMKTDPRYDRCTCTEFQSRLGHSVRRTFVARKDGGGEIVNAPLLASFVGGAAISSQWQPDRYRTAGMIARSAGISVGVGTGLNVLREFWPDIRKKLPFRNR